MRKLGVILTAALLSLALLAACARATPTPTPTPTLTPRPMSEGQRLYSQSCAACHGPNAEGTSVAPAIAGHSKGGLKMQVRNPMGAMPAFPQAQLSDRELDKIAEYISGLGPAAAPALEWEKAATETMHHWMALLAIESDDPEDARHHLQRALTYVKDPKHEAEMRKAMDLIAQGMAHDAAHEIEEMAGAESPSGITMQRFHLLLAQRSIEAEDAVRVRYHLEKFMVKASEEQKTVALEALELVEKGDFHEAEHEVEELLQEKSVTLIIY